MPFVLPMRWQHTEETQIAHRAKITLLHLYVALAFALSSLYIILALLLHHTHLMTQQFHLQLVTTV